MPPKSANLPATHPEPSSGEVRDSSVLGKLDKYLGRIQGLPNPRETTEQIVATVIGQDTRKKMAQQLAQLACNGQLQYTGGGKEITITQMTADNERAFANMRPAPYPDILSGDDIRTHHWLCVLYESWRILNVATPTQNDALIEHLQGLGFVIPEQYTEPKLWPKSWIEELYKLSMSYLGLPPIDNINQQSGVESGNNGHGKIADLYEFVGNERTGAGSFEELPTDTQKRILKRIAQLNEP